MTVYFLRHGETEYNAQWRYLGRTDQPLSPKGREELVCADFSPEAVYVSPLCRTAQTAEILFPEAERRVVPDFREMDFGIFEGRSANEMADDPAYRQWVDSGCLDEIPGGESRAAFSERACAAFAALLDEAMAKREDPLVIVAHGGTQMAVLERFALPRRDYFDWPGPNGGGYVLDAGRWGQNRTLRLLRTVQYKKGGTV